VALRLMAYSRFLLPLLCKVGAVPRRFDRERLAVPVRPGGNALALRFLKSRSEDGTASVQAQKSACSFFHFEIWL